MKLRVPFSIILVLIKCEPGNFMKIFVVNGKLFFRKYAPFYKKLH